MAKEIIGILITGILVENYILARFLGICPFIGVSKEIGSASGMGVAVTVVMLIATAVTWPVQTYILEPLSLNYLQTIVFILVIASLVQLTEAIIKRYFPPLYKSLGVYLPLITTNCAVLGVTLLNFTKEYNYLYSIVNALAAGLGFLLAMTLFAGVRSRIEESKVPGRFRGMPITFVAASIVSMSFMGFAGIV